MWINKKYHYTSILYLATVITGSQYRCFIISFSNTNRVLWLRFPSVPNPCHSFNANHSGLMAKISSWVSCLTCNRSSSKFSIRSPVRTLYCYSGEKMLLWSWLELSPSVGYFRGRPSNSLRSLIDEIKLSNPSKSRLPPTLRDTLLFPLFPAASLLSSFW